MYINFKIYDQNEDISTAEQLILSHLKWNETNAIVFQIIFSEHV